MASSSAALPELQVSVENVHLWIARTNSFTFVSAFFFLPGSARLWPHRRKMQPSMMWSPKRLRWWQGLRNCSACARWDKQRVSASRFSCQSPLLTPPCLAFHLYTYLCLSFLTSSKRWLYSPISLAVFRPAQYVLHLPLGVDQSSL